MTGPRTGAADLTAGVVGPRELVERIMLMGQSHGALSPGSPQPRLVAAAYREEQEAPDKVARLGPDIDVCLFASHVSYEFARRAGVLYMPATHIPLSGATLHAALLQTSVDARIDPGRISIDGVSRLEVEETYAEVGLSTENIQVREDATATPFSETVDFHEQHFRSGSATCALTGVHTVRDRLRQARVPVHLLRPTSAAIRSSLRIAALLGSNHRLEEAQLVVILVSVPQLRDTMRRSGPRYWRDELVLRVHRILVQECQRMHAAVWRLDDQMFLITATLGSVSTATDGFRRRPFVERVQSELRINIEVGIGLGRSAYEAERHARTALARAQSRQPSGFVVDRDGRPIAPSWTPPTGAVTEQAAKARETLTKLAERVADDPDPQVVDAERASEVLGVTARTARRLLRTLVEEGLAWPLPPDRAAQPGRPRQLYRLAVEQLDT